MLQFNTILYAKQHSLIDIQISGDSLEFRIKDVEHDLHFEGQRKGEGWEGLCRWNDLPALEWSALPSVSRPRFEEIASQDDGLPRATAHELGVSEAGLDALIETAERYGSDSLIVIRQGHVVCERYFGNPCSPIEAMSATKSVVAMAVALAIQEGDIDSFEVPVGEFYPEWSEGDKGEGDVTPPLESNFGDWRRDAPLSSFMEAPTS